MPVVPFLETTLGAPAIKIPISQATDYSALQVRGREGRESASVDIHNELLGSDRREACSGAGVPQ